MSKNLAAELQGLSGYDLQLYLEDKLDEIEEKLNKVPTRYPNPSKLAQFPEDQEFFE